MFSASVASQHFFMVSVGQGPVGYMFALSLCPTKALSFVVQFAKMQTCFWILCVGVMLMENQLKVLKLPPSTL